MPDAYYDQTVKVLEKAGFQRATVTTAASVTLAAAGDFETRYYLTDAGHAKTARALRRGGFIAIC